MPSAGAICPPNIIPIRVPDPSKPTNHIDTETYIELESSSPDCKLYFSTDGTKPNPYKRMVGGKEATFRYRGPFTLKPGKRTLRCIAVNRAGSKESSIVTKSFQVDKLSPADDDDDFFAVEPDNFSEVSDISYQSTLDNERIDHDVENRRRKEQQLAIAPAGPPGPKQAWAGSTNGKNKVDGPFNPVNYSGTQVNLWGMPPEMIRELAVGGGKAMLKKDAQPPLPPPQPMLPPPQPGISQQQLGMLTNQMIQVNNSEQPDNTAVDPNSCPPS